MREIADNTPRLQVFIARSDDARRRVYEFRSRVHTGQNAQRNADPLDRDALQIYVANAGTGETVASVRLNAGVMDNSLAAIRNMDGFGPFREFGVETLSISSELTVAPRWQDSQAASLAMCAVYKMARKCGSRFDFSHCIPGLVPLYQRLGYRRFRENYMDDALGYQVPLVLVTEDYAHLQNVRSPLMKIARTMDNPPDTGAWFGRTFPEYANAPVEVMMDNDTFWHFLARKLNQSPLCGIPLLEGLSYSDAAAFVRAGSVLHCRNGNAILKSGQLGREMFVILSGEVCVSAGSENTEIATLQKGDIFGELAYLSEVPRTADVIAKEDVELLVLNQEIVRRIMNQMPAIAARVLFNLSLILCGRLGQSTRDLVTASAPISAGVSTQSAPIPRAATY